MKRKSKHCGCPATTETLTAATSQGKKKIWKIYNQICGNGSIRMWLRMPKADLFNCSSVSILSYSSSAALFTKVSSPRTAFSKLKMLPLEHLNTYRPKFATRRHKRGAQLLPCILHRVLERSHINGKYLYFSQDVSYRPLAQLLEPG